MIYSSRHLYKDKLRYQSHMHCWHDDKGQVRTVIFSFVSKTKKEVALKDTRKA